MAFGVTPCGSRWVLVWCTPLSDSQFLGPPHVHHYHPHMERPRRPDQGAPRPVHYPTIHQSQGCQTIHVRGSCMSIAPPVPHACAGATSDVWPVTVQVPDSVASWQGSVRAEPGQRGVVHAVHACCRSWCHTRARIVWGRWWWWWWWWYQGQSNRVHRRRRRGRRRRRRQDAWSCTQCTASHCQHQRQVHRLTGLQTTCAPAAHVPWWLCVAAP